MRIIPAKKVVLISPTKVKGGRQIEYVSEKQQETGKVVSIGEGKLPVDMKVGDVIAYRQFGEKEFYIDGKRLLFVVFGDVLGVVKDS